MGRGKLRQYVISTICQMSVMMASIAASWFELMTTRLAKDPKLNLTEENLSWLIYIFTAGAVVGPLVSGDLTNRVGRKYVILSIGPLCLAGWVTFIWSKSMISLILVRLFQGLAVGVAYTIPPIYTAEIVEPNLRGMLSGTFEIAWGLGGVYSLSLCPFISYDNFAFTCIPLPIIFTIIWLFVPESPYYLLMTKRPDEANMVLKDLRDEHAEEEFQDMKKSVMEQMSNGSWKTLFCNKEERMAFLLVQIVSIVKYLSGITLIKNFAIDTISNSGILLPAEVMSIFVAFVITCIDTMSAVLSDSVGRKPLLLLSCYGCFIAHFLIGVYYYIDQEIFHEYKWILYTGLSIFCIFSGLGVGPLLFTLQSEMFGASTRGIAAGITEGSASFLSLLVTKLYAPAHDAYKVYINFWVYGIVSLAGGMVLSCLMYETAGKVIGQMMKTVIH